MKTKIYAIVIDDNPAIHTVMSLLPQREPSLAHLVIVACFTSCRTALRYLKKHGPVDVVFCDIELKSENGINEVAKFLDLTSYFLLITAYKVHLEAASKSLMHGYIMKPIQPKQIKAKLDDLERLWRKGRVMEDPDKTTWVKDVERDAPTEVKWGDVISIAVDGETANHVVVKTTMDRLRALGNLKTYKKKWLDTGLFVQLNQGVVVSKLHVRDVDGYTVRLDNGEVHTASQRNAHALVELRAYRAGDGGSD